MKGLSFARRLALVAVGVSLSGALHVVSLNTCAAQGPNAHDAQDFSLQASGSPLSELTTLAGILSERYGAKVVVDPAIAVTARPLVLGPKLPMETALDILTRPMRNVAWRRIYLAQHTKQPEPATLAAWVRALTGVEQHGLWCEDASAKRALTYTREGNGSPLIGQELEAGAWDPRPIYVLYSTTATDNDAGLQEPFAGLQDRQLRLLASLSPEQMANPMLQGMKMWQSLDPGTLKPFLDRMQQAGNLLWESTMPEERQQMLQDSKQVMQTFAGPAEADPNLPPPQNYLNDLQRLAISLARQYHVKILVDPAIFLSHPPQNLDRSLPLDKALDRLSAPPEEIAWRRLHLAEPDLATPLSPRKLSISVRALERLETDRLLLADLRANRAVRYVRSTLMPDGLGADLQAGGFRAETIYLLYSTSPENDRPLPPSARYADLQRQQMEMMLEMNADQLTQTMQRALDRVMTMPPDRRAQAMGLPILAGMMAIWFPRAAQEKRGPLQP